jgi:hypothetical protein
MDSYEACLAKRGLKTRGQAEHHEEHWGAQIGHLWGLEVNVEGTFGYLSGPYHASVAGDGENPKARVGPWGPHWRPVEGEEIARD